MNDVIILEDFPVRSGKALRHNIYINTDYVIFVPVDKRSNARSINATYLLGGAIVGGVRDATHLLINNSRRKKNKEKFKTYSLEEIKKIPNAVTINRNQIDIIEIPIGFMTLIGEEQFYFDKDAGLKFTKAIKSLD